MFIDGARGSGVFSWGNAQHLLRKPRARREQLLDGVREMLVRDVVVAAIDSELVRLHQDLGRAVALRRFKIALCLVEPTSVM
jgi:hypothetical protein